MVRGRRCKHVLEIAMIVCMPRSVWKAWRYHIAEKSPIVQPTRQRRVLIAARFQIGLDDQNCDEVGGGTVDLLLQAGFGLFLVHSSLRCVMRMLGWNIRSRFEDLFTVDRVHWLHTLGPWRKGAMVAVVCMLYLFVLGINSRTRDVKQPQHLPN
jgi:hypothetical protein